MRRITIPAVILIFALTVAGCSAAPSSTDSGTSGSASSGNESVVPKPATGDAVGGTTGGSVISANREVVTTGTVTITADDPLAASEKAVKIVEAAGGRIDARTENAPVGGNHGSATLDLRIPAAVLTATLDEIKKLGAVDQIQLSAADVTTQGQDLDARIAALSASVDRLLTLLATAKDAKVLIELETALSDRQGELDSLKAQRRYLSDQVAMSTITLNLQSKSAQPLKAPSTFWDSLTAGLAGFGTFFTTVFLVFGYLLPWIVFAGIVTLVIIWSVRRSRRKATPPPAP